MDDQLLMRVLDGGAHAADELDALAARGVALAHVAGERDAVDVLHHEVRLTVLGRAAIEHPHDARVIERRQDLALVAKSRDRLRRAEAVVQDLDRDATLVLRVIPFSEVDGTHPTLAEELDEPVGAVPLPEERRGSFADELRDPGPYRRGQDGRCIGRVREQRCDLAPQLEVGACGLEERRPLGLGERIRLDEQVLDALPARGGRLGSRRGFGVTHGSP